VSVAAARFVPFIGTIFIYIALMNDGGDSGVHVADASLSGRCEGAGGVPGGTVLRVKVRGSGTSSTSWRIPLRPFRCWLR
jgi:hypothetical protein